MPPTAGPSLQAPPLIGVLGIRSPLLPPPSSAIHSCRPTAPAPGHQCPRLSAAPFSSVSALSQFPPGSVPAYNRRPKRVVIRLPYLRFNSLTSARSDQLPVTTRQEPFRISTGLKDLIGRDLITNDFVAVFELVKNSFDAHATQVQILFEPDKIVITDNGKGMSRQDILRKWLFIAYSAKRDGTEDNDYRHKLSAKTRPFTGDKGVGRFSCDRLGRRLTLRSRAERQPVQVVRVDWTSYEQDANAEFDTIRAQLAETPHLPGPLVSLRAKTGTVLEMTGLRHTWTRDDFLALRRGLSKLINPFVPAPSGFQIKLMVPAEKRADARTTVAAKVVNGLIKNQLLDVLKDKTTCITVSIPANRDVIETTLEDRGSVVYKIRETNPFDKLRDGNIRSDIYYLNQSAKNIFKRRMGLRSVEFGSIFLFRNGFRIFPIGEEDDDFFSLARRKQQGVRRYLGTRDVIGRIDVTGMPGISEATSRDKGLIRTPPVESLIALVQKCIRRLERYVVDITWRDPSDKHFEDTSRMTRDQSRASIAQLVARLADTKGVELIDYNPDLVAMVDARSDAFETSLDALTILAEQTSDAALIRQVATAKEHINALRVAEATALEAAQRSDEQARAAQEAAKVASVKYQDEWKRNKFLVAAASLDKDTILNLHHQIIMQAADVHLGVKRMMRRLRDGAVMRTEEWIDFLDKIAFRNSQILTASRFATKGGYRRQSVESDDNLAGYIHDYINTVSTLWAPRGIRVECEYDRTPFCRPFRPIDVGIVIDNLVSNAAKAYAKRIRFVLVVTLAVKPRLTVHIADDGDGWPRSFDPISRVFDKGTTTTRGSGLGLYHISQVIEGMRGTIEAHRETTSHDLPGAQLTLTVGV